MKDLNDIMLNPIRMRIIQIAATCETITASDICDRLADIPRTTVYRHIKILIDSHVLSIVSEHKIRGSLERILALNTQEIVSHNTLENASQNAFRFLMNRYVQFEKYFNNKKADPAKERIFLNNTIMMASDEEFDNFLMELQGLFRKYNYEYSENRKTRDISIISAPVETQEVNDNKKTK